MKPGKPSVLIIAGVDSSGGAGLLRDVRTLADLGAEPLCAVTAVTAQTDAGVLSVHPIPPSVISTQIKAALANPQMSAIKIGMLGTAETVEVVREQLTTDIPIILDPVLHATSGGALLGPGGREAMLRRLFPLATLVTPNFPEAAALLECEPARDEADAVAQARQLLAFGPAAVLLKGGHGTGSEATDYLVSASGLVHRLVLSRVNAIQRGTGCALGSAIAARMAAGLDVHAACLEAKKYVHSLITARRTAYT